MKSKPSAIKKMAPPPKPLYAFKEEHEVDDYSCNSGYCDKHDPYSCKSGHCDKHDPYDHEPHSYAHEVHSYKPDPYDHHEPSYKHDVY